MAAERTAAWSAGSPVLFEAEQRRRNGAALVRAWRRRAAVLELRANVLAAEGDLYGPHSAEDCRAAAFDWRKAADILEEELLAAALEEGPADFKCGGATLAMGPRPRRLEPGTAPPRLEDGRGTLRRFLARLPLAGGMVRVW